MKRMIIAGGLAVLLAGGAAMAQDGTRGGRQSADTDGDSRISQAEFVAVALARFDARDTNRDGTITAEEVRAAGEARREQRREARFARMDTIGDGSISRAEFDAVTERRGEARNARAERGERGERGGRQQVRRVGRGGPGGRIEADGITRAEAQTRAEASFARMDRNGDGVLTAEDRQGRRGARGAAASE